MGLLSDFREVVKGLKRKKPGQTTVNACPKCGSRKLTLSSGYGIYGITPTKYACAECGYKGPIVLEQEIEKTD